MVTVVHWRGRQQNRIQSWNVSLRGCAFWTGPSPQHTDARRCPTLHRKHLRERPLGARDSCQPASADVGTVPQAHTVRTRPFSCTHTQTNCKVSQERGERGGKKKKRFPLFIGPRAGLSGKGGNTRCCWQGSDAEGWMDPAALTRI